MNTIIDWFKSLLESIKERAKNPFTESNKTPFAGAFLIALILYNWELFFSLINFDPADTRESKIKIIQLYLENNGIAEKIGCPVGIAFLSILFYYSLNNMSLAITTLFNKWVKPWVLLLDKNKLVPKEDYDRVVRRMNELRQSKQDLQDAVSVAEEETSKYKSRMDSIEQRVQEETKELQDQNASLRNGYSESQKLATEVDDLRREIAKLRFEPTIYFDKETTIGPNQQKLAKTDFILSKQGTIAAWIKLPPVSDFYKELMNNRYIIAHDTNAGTTKGVGYQNALGFSITPNFHHSTKRLPSAVWFRLWFSNEEGNSNDLCSEPLSNNKEEWCHVMFRWNRIDPSIELLINGEQVRATSDVKCWPQRINPTCLIGNWKINDRFIPIHNLGLPLFRLVTATDYLSNYWVREEMKSHRPT